MPSKMYAQHKPITERIDLKYKLSDSSPEEVIKEVSDASKELRRRGCINIRLKIEADKEYDSYGDGYSVTSTVEMIGERDETLEETAKREKEQAARTAQFEKDSREQYERLKARFEGKK